MKRRGPVRWALFGMIAVFDLGIYDQASGCCAHPGPVRHRAGPRFFSDTRQTSSCSPWCLLLAGHPLFLLVVQVVAQGLGALAIYLLARDFLGARWPAVAVASLLLLHPTYQFHVWEVFHLDVVAVAPLLFAYWAACGPRRR